MQKPANNVLFWVVGAALVAGCAARNGPAGAVDVKAPVPGPADTRVAPTPLPALTEEERDRVGRLKATVQHLSVEIGERNIAQSWNLASATDDLAIALEKIGYDVQRQGLVAGDAVVQNIAVHVTGGERGGEAYVVGAHYDTAAGASGADDDASGVAVLMELARLFHDRKAKRALHFAFFVNGEAPYFETDQMGSLVYAKSLKALGLTVKGMLSLDGLGVYGEGPPVRPYPVTVPPYPASSDFLALIGNEASRPLLEQVSASLRDAGSGVPVIASVLEAEMPLARGSDHWAFWKLGMPALLLTDAGEYRYKDYHQKTDQPANLDFERLARVVTALQKTLTTLADEG
jgi:hypothetical protein